MGGQTPPYLTIREVLHKGFHEHVHDTGVQFTKRVWIVPSKKEVLLIFAHDHVHELN
jgi:hypothetical protein